MMFFDRPTAPRFQNTYCSQCGGEFGPGNSGFSHCHDHRPVYAVVDTTTGTSLAKSKTYLGARRAFTRVRRRRPESVLNVAEQWPTRRG